jgi:hypothetical protein
MVFDCIKEQGEIGMPMGFSHGQASKCDRDSNHIENFQQNKGMLQQVCLVYAQLMSLELLLIVLEIRVMIDPKAKKSKKRRNLFARTAIAGGLTCGKSSIESPNKPQSSLSSLSLPFPLKWANVGIVPATTRITPLAN